MKKSSSLIAQLKILVLLSLLSVSFIACDDDDDVVDTRTFTVVIENVSTATTLQPGAMPDRTAPISPGVWAVINTGSLFQLDQMADEGTERIAEEGMTNVKTAELNGASWVDVNGEFSSPAGANGPVIGAGESATFTFDADPGQKLQIMTMFGQSNDWFYAFGGGGLDLFNGDDPIDGDVTSEIVLYDAGTELDEMPGLGLTQAPDHPGMINVGPVDPVDMIKIATSRHTTFVIPPTSGVLKVTITSSL
jgi:hypothetical protein